MHALASDGVEVGRQCRDQGLALTGLHLGDVAEVKRRATHELHVVVTKPEHTSGRFTDGAEGLRQERVERLSGLVAFAERGRDVTKLFVAVLLECILKAADLLGDALELAKGAPFAHAENLLEN